MKLRKSDISLLVAALGILVAVGTYFLVYTKCNERTDALNAENADLQKEVDELQEMADHKQEYLDETARMQTEIDEIIAKFGPEFRPEDQILYALDLKENYDLTVKGIQFTPAMPIEVSAPVTETAQAEDAAAEEAATTEDGAVDVSTETPVEEAAPQKLLYRCPVSISVLTSYNSFKDVIAKITTDQERKSIEGITLAFDDETGDLAGTVDFSMYAMTGTDKEYVIPDVSGVRYGSNNIFKSADKKSVIQAEKAAEKAAKDQENSAE